MSLAALSQLSHRHTPSMPERAVAGMPTRSMPSMPARSMPSMPETAASFESLLAKTTAAADALRDPAAKAEIREQARSSAETLVAQTLIAPLLAQLRDTNHAAEPFGVSEAEKRLGPVFDEKIATQMVQRMKLPMVEQVERSLLKRSGLDPQAISKAIAPSATPTPAGGLPRPKDVRA